MEKVMIVKQTSLENKFRNCILFGSSWSTSNENESTPAAEHNN